MTATLHKLPLAPEPSRVPPPEVDDGERGLKWRIRIGGLITLALVLGIGGWSSAAQIAGAVIAPGYVVLDSNIKRVQHPTGGVVGAIRVRNGDKVQAGDVVVRLDDTQTRAALGIVESQLIELTGRRARLVAERDGLETIVFPHGFEAQSADSRQIAEGERRFLTARRSAIAGQKRQLQERIGQIEQEINGLTSQRDAKLRELGLVREELVRVEDMHNRTLTPVTRVLAMRREETRIAGEHGALVSQIARAKGQIAEIELQLATIDHTVQSDAQRELRDIEARHAELRERRLAAEDQLNRIEIRAPVTGVVHDSAVHTVGGVVNAAEPLMTIVPTGDKLFIEARIAPTDIDQVHVGQKVVLRLSALNHRQTPEVDGTVTRVGADLTRDPRDSAARDSYVIRVAADPASLARVKTGTLVPGMPVEAFIQTGERSALSYVLKPLTDQVARAFRED